MGEVVLVVLGALAATQAAYLAALAVAALCRRGRTEAPVRSSAASPALAGPRTRLTVVVPAYNEMDYIARCVQSLRAQDYPSELSRVVVVADNCTDATADLARAAGAEVLVRDEPDHRGKGAALRWAIDRCLAASPTPDALVVVDADSVADVGMLSGLVRTFEAGADAVQGEYLALPADDSARSALRAGALLLFHRVRPSGRAALGLPACLVGNGMLLGRRVLEARPWTAYTSTEDLEYSVQLYLAGVRPAFAPAALVRAPLEGRGQGRRTQRRRWLGGRAHVIRTYLPSMLGAAVRCRRWWIAGMSLDLTVPPVGLLGLLAASGLAVSAVGVATGAWPGWVSASWAASVASLGAFVLVGLHAGGAPASAYRALLRAPLFLGSELLDCLSLVRGLGQASWKRTERPSDRRDISRRLKRVEIGGIPIDALDMDGALQRAVEAVEAHTFTQICTVNVDFLVNAYRDSNTRTILREARLNLADGAPVVWLGRLLGQRLPERVAGADFVLRLMGALSNNRTRVFLLGGENGAAHEAAARLLARYPKLVIAGVYEPPRGEVGDLDDGEIIRRLHKAAADVLLVAFGHPKQEAWIYRQRGQLATTLAIGVGCTFDLIAGRLSRAPRWMQRSGLEWFYRLVHEPVRLLPRYATDAWWLAAVLVPGALRHRLAGDQV